MTLAMFFPGQGSQSIGMLAELAEVFPLVTETFEEASETLGFDMWKLCQQGPEEELNKTVNTQPAMLIAGVACARVWQQQGGPAATVMAGHSLGEYSALVSAGVLSLADAAALTQLRGELMQTAVPEGEGAMAAVLGMTDEAITELCAAVAEGEVVEPVNFNAPGQVVVAGHRTAVDRLVAAAPEHGAKLCKVLAVSVPAHSSLMQPAADKLAERLATLALKAPTTPVVHNVDANTHTNLDDLRTVLTQQVCKPVRWVQCVEKSIELGAEQIVELGPGRVLTGLQRRINKVVPAKAVFSPESLEAALAAVS